MIEGLDQIDLNGPFEVFARIPNSTCHIAGKTRAPVRDARGLVLTPQITYAEVPPLDVLHVPGGPGQEALMRDDETLAFIRTHAAGATYDRPPRDSCHVPVQKSWSVRSSSMISVFGHKG